MSHAPTSAGLCVGPAARPKKPSCGLGGPDSEVPGRAGAILSADHRPCTPALCGTWGESTGTEWDLWPAPVPDPLVRQSGHAVGRSLHPAPCLEGPQLAQGGASGRIQVRVRAPSSEPCRKAPPQATHVHP